MARRIKDTDYLANSARIRWMENHLLTRERLEQILDARSDEEVEKLLQEFGYPGLDPSHPEAMDAVLAQVREEVLEDLAFDAPDTRYIDIFKLKYDYHNVKAVLKAEVMGVSPDRMLMDMGRIPAQTLKEAILGKGEEDAALGDDTLPAMLSSAVKEAREVLHTTRDPQLADIVLDRWCYQDMAAVAKASRSAFLMGYVRTQIDAVNLRALVRTLRMGKNDTFLADVLIAGGDFAPEKLLEVSAAQGKGLAELYADSAFAEAAAAGAKTLDGGPLIAFEKLCDDAVTSYLARAQFVTFGEAPLVGYLAARETEYTNLRILLTGRYTGLAPDVIRARLRASYV